MDHCPPQASQFEAFVRAAPQGRFVVIDMSEDGKGFWKKWDDASFFGAPFIWTTLHDFGGNVGIKGNVSQINQVRSRILFSNKFHIFLQKYAHFLFYNFCNIFTVRQALFL